MIKIYTNYLEGKLPQDGIEVISNGVHYPLDVYARGDIPSGVFDTNFVLLRRLL